MSDASGSDSKSSDKIHVYCAIGSLGLLAIFLICTELIFDRSVLLCLWLLIITVVVAIAPLFLGKLESSKRKMASIGFAVVTAILIGVLFWKGNKIYYYHIDQGTLSDTNVVKEIIEKYLSPSGGMVIMSDTQFEIQFPEEYKELKLDSDKEGELHKLVNDKKRISGYQTQFMIVHQVTGEELKTYEKLKISETK